MNIRQIIEKAIIKGEKLGDEERIHLLDYFDRAEQTAAPSNPVTGQVSIPSQHEIDLMVQEAVSSSLSNYFPRLSDITSVMGTVVAGEFRTGNFATPGDGFTGGRFGYPGFEYDGDTYFLVGVEDDVLQVGLSLTDGTITAGAGDISISGEGIWIENQQAAFGFEDTNGDRGNIYLSSNATDDLQLVNRVVGGLILQRVDSTDTSLLDLSFGEHPDIDNVARLFMQPPSGEGVIVISNGIALWSGRDGTETVFNSDGKNVDFRIEGENVTDVFFVDASEDRIEIGADHYIPTRNSSNPNVIFNEANEDIDFKVEGDTDGNLFWVDAGLDAIGMGGAAESGYKLKVHGEINATGDINVNGVALATGDYVDDQIGLIEAQFEHSFYTPTLTNTTNVAASSVSDPFNYLRIGSQVFVSGAVQIDPTAAANTVLTLTLPVSSTFTNAFEAGGGGQAQATNTVGAIASVAATSTVTLTFQATDIASRGWRVWFMYRVI